MASALPVFCMKINAVRPPPLTLLLILLLLSLVLALTVFHIVEVTPPPPAFLSSFFLPDFPFAALQLQQQYLGFLLSPCPIFILANLIVFTLLLKSFYPSLSSHTLSDTEYALPEHFYTASHGDFFLPSHLHQLSCPPEDCHVLSFTKYTEEPPMQEYIKQLGPEIKENMPDIIKGASQQQIKKLQKEEVQAKLSSKKSSEGNGRERVKGPSKGRSDLEPSMVAISSNAAVQPQLLEKSKPSALSQVVVINMEAAPQISCAASSPSQQIKQSVGPASAAAKEVEHNNSKGKKDVVLAGVVTKDGKEALKAKDLGAKQAKHDKIRKPAATISPNYKNMVRSHSDQRLSQRASAYRSIQRARSMKSNPPSSSHFQPISSSDPAALTSLDGLSDDEANKRFSDFIANRFALMKRESLDSSTS